MTTFYTYPDTTRKWTLKNKNNEFALSLHFRTRFRAFYAMQFFTENQTISLLREYEKKIGEESKNVIKKYVLNNTVVKFIQDCSKLDDKYIAIKAQEVLSELVFIWKDKNVKNEIPF